MSYEKPIEFHMKKIRQDGLVEINFNQDLVVPDLKQSQKSYDVKNRMLQESSLRDILSIDLDPSDQDYAIEIVEWTEKGLKIRIVFDNPLQVSAMDQSTISFEINNVDFFKTKGGQKLGKEFTKMEKEVPIQLPKNISFE